LKTDSLILKLFNAASIKPVKLLAVYIQNSSYENLFAHFIRICLAKCLYGISPGYDGTNRTPFNTTTQRGYPSCGSSGTPTTAY
jgi:hypothetical protein